MVAQKCACRTCRCSVDANQAVNRGGQLFCSEQCAQGHQDHQGCGHADCPCRRGQ